MSEPVLTEIPNWLVAGLPWIVALFVLIGTACAIALWMLVAGLRGLDRLDERLEVLAELTSMVRKLTSEREDIDLRRLEHVVVDIRDGQKRTEDVLLRAVETQAQQSRGESDGVLVPATPSPTVSERVVNRLLAMGYERVQIISRAADVMKLANDDGEVLIEAHRQGALYKGTVLVRGGTISDVELHPSYSIFP
ncbi:MAG: hypothetical protein ACI8TQ_000751 [Planctomycetota bacterium]|jgi:hypothetical protein